LDGESNYLKNNFKKNFGVLIEDGSLIEEFDCFSFLKFVGSLYNMKKNELDFKIKVLTDYFFENNFRNDIIKHLSTGMKKKLGICAAVLHTPNILILDEPFSGLDPVSSKLLIDFLIKYQNNQRIILVSSHNLEYMQELSTHIGVLENGELIFNGTVEKFTNNSKTKLSDALINILSPSNANIEKITWI
jgi:ABC-2 type transport system ATP-binding protein